MKIVVDCAHGDLPHCPDVPEIGAEVISRSVPGPPRTEHRRRLSGATRPRALASSVARSTADLGVALDGDGDPRDLVDGNGEIVDGDEILTSSRVHAG